MVKSQLSNPVLQEKTGHGTRSFLLMLNLAPGLGFEPRLPGPEPGVLPLDDPGIREEYTRLSQEILVFITKR